VARSLAASFGLPLGYWFFFADKPQKEEKWKKANKKKTSSGQTVAPCQSPHMILTAIPDP